MPATRTATPANTSAPASGWNSSGATGAAGSAPKAERVLCGVTQKLTPALSPDEAQIKIRTFFAWRPHVLDTATIEQAWQVQRRYRFNWWEVLIAAAAQLSGCGQLLTEDLQEGQNLEGLVVVNPFAS